MNIEYLNSDGYYFIDHAFTNDTYWKAWKVLGRQFVEKYVGA
ncbi:MAG TPA: hypothetical protein VIH61_07085 [Waddliaceae bacterium]